MNKQLSILFGSLIIVGLFIPMAQQFIGFMYVSGLNGVVKVEENSKPISWWDRSVQKQLENYSTDSLSLRPACIRLKNQFEFSIFDKLNAQDIYEHNGVFYRYTYITYNERTSFVGMEKIQRQVSQLKRLQEKLNKDSIPIYVLITPTKLHQYRQHLPWYNKTTTNNTNYIQYKKLLIEAGINVLDTDEWFSQNEGTFKAPTMSTGGVHWTLYGGALAMDSLVKRIHHDKGVDFQEVQMELSKEYELYPEDMDVVNLCNLMFKPEDRRLRLVEFPTPKNPKRRIHPVVISDSFFNVISWTPLHDQIFVPETPFYYYFQTRKMYKGQLEIPVKNMNYVKKDIQQSDCIILITDIQNMEQFGFGFIEKFRY